MVLFKLSLLKDTIIHGFIPITILQIKIKHFYVSPYNFKFSLTINVCMRACSVGSDSVIPWTVAHQAPLSLRFPRQEYWSAVSLPPPGDLWDLETEPTSPDSPARGFFTREPPGKPHNTVYLVVT